ncbi:MAG: BadF/BadG/BcrA/BcrD ATPase family protein [Eubacteriales bacterium]
MEQRQCYLAVDGGNSKTEYRLLDESGIVVASRRSGGSNHETMAGGFDEAAHILIGEIEELLEPNGYALEHVVDAVLGLAGADNEDEAQALQNGLRSAGLEQCFVCNDGYLGVLAGTESGVGICFSAGSGVTCAGINQEGARAQFGGIGVLSGDVGGGYDIAAFVYQCVYQHLFFNNTYTVLKDAYFTLFDVRSPEAFRASAARIQNEEAARQLIGLFFTAVETGDEIALRYAAKPLRTRRTASSQRPTRFASNHRVQVSLSGSILSSVAPPAYRRMIEYELFRRKGKLFQLSINTRPPVEGAVRWVRQRNQLLQTP